MPTTLKKINAVLAEKHPGVVLYRGERYHYIVCRPERNLYTDSIMTCYTNSMTIEQWVDAVDGVLDNPRNSNFTDHQNNDS